MSITSKLLSGARAVAFVVCVAPALAMAADTTQSTPEVESVRSLAEQGDANAEYFLGVLYVYGEHKLGDPAEGVAWFRKAAEQGNSHRKAVRHDAV